MNHIIKEYSNNEEYMFYYSIVLLVSQNINKQKLKN